MLIKQYVITNFKFKLKLTLGENLSMWVDTVILGDIYFVYNENKMMWCVKWHLKWNKV